MTRPDQWSPVRNDPPPDLGGQTLQYDPGTEVTLHRPKEGQPVWQADNRLSREYKVPDENGQDRIVRLYTVGAVAAALNKKSVTVRRWIQKGWLPDSGLRTQGIPKTLGDAGRRLWTEEQVRALLRIGLEEGVTKPNPSTQSLDRFAGRVRTLWQQNNW